MQYQIDHSLLDDHSEFPLQKLDRHEDFSERIDYCVLLRTLVLKMPEMSHEEVADKFEPFLMLQAQRQDNISSCQKARRYTHENLKEKKKAN